MPGRSLLRSFAKKVHHSAQDNRLTRAVVLITESDFARLFLTDSNGNHYRLRSKRLIIVAKSDVETAPYANYLDNPPYWTYVR